MRDLTYWVICGLLTAVSIQFAHSQRLPSGVLPSHYKIFLDPNIAGKTFSGEETIDVQIDRPAGEIVMNSLGIEISFAEVVSRNVTQVAKLKYDAPSEMVRLELADAVMPGPAKIHLKFSAPLTNGLRGLYLSHSAHRAYAVTQFEGTYARMMFPCFDEPNYKATFDLTVTAANGDTAISNGRIIRDTPITGTDRHQITFSTSPKMSTYLLALAIGDWACLERTVENVPIRVCAVPEKKDFGRFALDVATHSIEFYNQWYGIPYSFGKLDMVAIPDYEWGGMENTASIFYRDTALLLDDSTASVFTRRNQAVIIAHEIAHQWFGDLVTAAWWDDIWLNEGFATWMESKPIAAWHPEWKLENSDASSAQRIISLDSLGATRAIHGNPTTSSEIKEMFDGITYEKGAAVLSMLESYVGSDVFRKSVNAYLETHANGNASAADFWTVVAKVSGKPVDKIMPSFVMQAGVPVLTAELSCKADNSKVEFSQDRFLLATQTGAATTDSLWQIPVCMKGPERGQDRCVVVSSKEQTLSANNCPPWLFMNRDAKGYYRVAYAQDDLQKLASIAETQLNVPERVAMVEDAWATSLAGRAPITGFMHVVESMRKEREVNVLDLIAEHLNYIDNSLVQPKEKQSYSKFVQEQFAPLAEEIGWNSLPSDTDETKGLRATLLRALGLSGDPAAVAKSQALVQEYFKDPDSVEGTLIPAAFAVVAEHGDAAFYEQLYSRLERTDSPQEYNLSLSAIASFGDPQLANRTLQLIRHGNIRQENYPSIFSALLNNSASRDATWDYLKANWSDLAEKVTSFGGRGAVSALGSACSSTMRDDIKQFFSTHAAPGAERTAQQSLEQIDICTAFRQKQQASFDSWLAR